MNALAGLVVLIVVAGVVAAAITRRARGEVAAEPETTGFFVYLAMYVALLTFAIGLSGALSGLIDRPTAGRAVTAAELASTLVALPVFVALARTTLHRLRANPHERRGFGWSAYITASLLTTLVVSLLGLMRLIGDFIDGDRVGTELGVLLVWAPLWLIHWLVWSAIGDERRPNAYWVLASTLGVAWLASGGIWVMAIALRRIVNALADAPSAMRATTDLEDALILLGLGAVTWWWHWLRTGFQRPESTARLVYLLIVGVFGGLITFYLGAVTALAQSLIWILGDPGRVAGRVHFEDVATFAAVGVGGALVWWYHRIVVGPRRDERRTEIDRLYDHLVVGVAALVTTSALITLGIVVLSLLAPPAAVAGEAEASNLVLSALSLLVFGTPTWFVRWRELQRRRRVEEIEARSPTRRFYLLVILALSGTVAFISGIVTLAAVLGSMTGERTGSLLADLRVPLAALVGGGALGWYHLRLYLDERHLFARAALREITLVVPAGADLGELEAVPGFAITRIDMAPDGATVVDIAEIERTLAAVEGERVLAIVRPDGVETIRLA